MSDYKNEEDNKRFKYNIDELKEKYKKLREKTFIFYINLIIYIILTSILISYFGVPLLGKYEKEINPYLYIIFIILLSIFGGIYFRNDNSFFGIYIGLIIFFLSSFLIFIFAIYPQSILYKGNILSLYLFYLKIGYHLRILFFNFLTFFFVFISVYYFFKVLKR